jgi:hypothetical protein
MATYVHEWKRSPAALRDLIAVVHAQLPRDLQGRFAVDVTSDAYHISAVAKFTNAAGREWTCKLETCEIEGVPVSCQVPPEFVAQLCL